MPRPDLSRVGTFFHNYIRQVPQDDVITAIKELGTDFVNVMKSIPADKHDYAYAKGKWTLKEVFQHVIDTERILSYRALCFARKEQQSRPGFEENDYAANSRAATRNWNDMIEEYTMVRKATEMLYKTFDDETLQNEGIANKNPMYVLALGFIISGHCQHHLNIIRERYL